MRYLLFFFMILISCSPDDTQNLDENPDNENPISEGRYKVSFNASGLNGTLHYKATYKFDDTEEIVIYNDVTTGFMIGDAFNKIDLWIEMIDENTYLDLNYLSFKVEDLETGNIREISGFCLTDDCYYPNQYIISPDMLTEFDFLNNLYGYNLNSPRNQYKTHFYATLNSNGFASQYGGGGVSESDYYDYRNDILVHKPTRGSLRIVVDTAAPNLPSQYHLETEQNAWLIRDNSSNPSNGFFNTLEATMTLSQLHDFNSNNVDKTYELILPSNMSELTLKFWGDDANATVYLMRKDGTTETETITILNNLQTLNFDL